MAAATTLLLVRHGEHSHGGRFWQHHCPGLTERGREQAGATAEALGPTVVTVDAVLSSLAARAWQTAETIAIAHKLEVERICDLCEMHPGNAEGMTVEEMNEVFGPHYGLVPGAEYYPDWLPGGIARLMSLASSRAGGSTICVTHTAVLRASLFAFGGWDPDDAQAIRFGNCSITEWVHERGMWTLTRLNDDRHLAVGR